MSIEADRFYGKISTAGEVLRDILSPLTELEPRDRAVFIEYHYFKTHMKVIAESHKISLGRTYELLYRAEDKIAGAQVPEA